MSMREELKRIKNEKEAERKQLDEQYAKIEEKKQQAASKFNPMVRGLLDELGFVAWGEGKYQVGQQPGDTTVWIVRSVPVYARSRELSSDVWTYEGFFVKLCFDIEGNPSHFLVPFAQGDLGTILLRWPGDFGKKVGTSESELEMALIECFKVGPTSVPHAGSSKSCKPSLW